MSEVLDPGTELDALRSRLKADLRAADDESFLRLIFAVDTLQGSRTALAAPLLRGRFPEAAVGATLPSLSRIHEWELETLANEALAQPYRRLGFEFPSHYLDCHNYYTIAHLTNLLRQIEDLEYALSGVHVLKEMSRIAARQFEWQRGFFNKTSLYRSAFLFDGPECRARLQAKTGFPFNDLSFAGFALHTVFNHFSQLDRNLPLAHVGISDELRNATLKLLSIPIDDARTMARTQRAGWDWIAYRPSILRQKPCIALRYSGTLIIAPLPSLILERTSSGIFYDIVSEEGSIRNEIGTRFEDYCDKLIGSALGELNRSREFSYNTQKGSIRTPDILLGSSLARWALIECKAARMSFPARYRDEFESERGYDEIAKAVFQIWRYAAHCRLGLVTDKLTDDCLGVVITLDSWMLMGSGSVYETIFSKARALAAAKEPRILLQDQIPITFTQISEWEELLTSSNEQGLRRVLKASTGDEFRGWLLSSIPRTSGEKKKYRYPFRDFNEVVPWWRELTHRGAREQLGGD